MNFYGDTVQSITKVLSVPLTLSFSLSTLEGHKCILFISVRFFQLAGKGHANVGAVERKRLELCK